MSEKLDENTPRDSDPESSMQSSSTPNSNVVETPISIEGNIIETETYLLAPSGVLGGFDPYLKHSKLRHSFKKTKIKFICRERLVME